MTIIKSKNGVFFSAGQLEKSGLAIAFNAENLIFKIKKLNSVNWKSATEKLINENVHTVLAQYNANDQTYPVRMLNAGGLLTFINSQEPNALPLLFAMIGNQSGLQLGFGKVELKDLDENLANVQSKLDNTLKTVLIEILEEALTSDDFIKRLNSDDIKTQLESLETIINKYDQLFDAILSGLASNCELVELQSAFGRPSLNKFAAKAIKTAAIREITEEIQFKNDYKLDKERLVVSEALNRETATHYVRSVLNTKEENKFSAKELNNDFESTTFVVNYSIDKTELAKLIPQDNCLLIKPKEVQIEVKNSEKGILQTTLTDYPPIVGGGNQFTVALFCKNVFNIQANCVVEPEPCQNTGFSPF